MTGGTLVIGASQAGLHLAASLRSLGDTAPITLVGAEKHAPYERPPLSKDHLAGTGDPASLLLRDPGFYPGAGIDLICDERVRTVDVDGDGGGTAGTASGRTLTFDRLALTTGARPRRLEVPGADLAGVCYLRDLDDATALRGHLASARRVVVVGGGFIGLEAAEVARGLGAAVTVVETADRLIPRAVAPVVSRFYRDAHVRRGTEVLLGSSVVAISGEGGRVRQVVLGDGRVLAADVVVVGVGVLPRTELAEQLGLRCERGIVVDSLARTSNPTVVAAGDCTVMPHPVTGDGFVRLESVQNAVAQAAVAAATLLGRPAPAPAVPWFWSNQGTLKLQIAGLAGGHDQVVLRGDPDTEQFSALYYREGALLAVDAVNTPIDYLVVRKALTQNVNLPADQVGDPSVPLKAVLAAQVAAA